MRYVTVRVVDSGGRPQSDTKVSVFVHQFLAAGMKGPEYTDSEGSVEFALDIDATAEISIYVNGDEAVQRGSVRAEYKVIV